MSEIVLTKASLADLPQLVSLFDAYRQFYKQASDENACKNYLAARLGNHQAVVFLASLNGQVVGFTLLYDTFTSVALAPLSILNDLYVVDSARGHGVATALIARAREHAKQHGSFRLRLRTAKDNQTAQRVYDQTGFVRDEVFYTYDLNP